MQDFNKIIQAVTDKRAEIENREQNIKYEQGQKKAEQPATFESMHQDYVDKQKEFEASQNPPAQDPGDKSYDLSTTSDLANEMSVKEQGLRQTIEKQSGGNPNMYQTPQVRGGLNPNKINDDFYGYSKENLTTGIGVICALILIYFLCKKGVK